MPKYKCTVCGYIYYEEKGYPDGNVPAGTEWKDVPKEFRCPRCMADKNAFEEVK